MKTKYHLHAISFALLILIFAGCKKEPVASFTGCRIVSVISSAMPGVDSRAWYDISGRIVYTESGPFKTTYTYNQNHATVVATSNGAFFQKVIYTLNAAGLTTNTWFTEDSTGTVWHNLAYEYNGQEITRSIVTSSSGGGPTITTYTWVNGNVSQSVDYLGLVTTYAYYPELSRLGDYYATIPLNAPGHIIRNKNLLKTIIPNNSSVTPINVSYEFDADGKIISRTTINNTTSTNYFGYECN
jgi:hypothetical protein